MSKQVMLNVSLTLNDGKADAFQAIARDMVEASRKEPGTLGYEWYISSDGKRCQLIETYVDAEALLAHFAGPVVKEGVPKMMATVTVTGFQVYGEPGRKARDLLAGFGAEIFSHALGMNG